MTIAQDIALRIPAIRRLHEARNTLLDERQALLARLAACEAPAGGTASAFFHYNACFNPQAVIRRPAVPGLLPRAGCLTNFLGVVIDPKFFPAILAERAGQVEAVPIPANWHADIAEWGAALRAVDLASGSFTMIELGCGWGCWMNNTGAAARHCALDVRLIGVEGDEGHVAFAREACTVNGFLPAQVSLHRGIAAACDAQLDMLAGRRHAPALHAGQIGVAEHVVAGVPVEHAAAVHPGPEVGGNRHVRAGGDDVLGEVRAFALPAPDLRQDAAKRRLGAVSPTEPVEKSTSGPSLVRLGQLCTPPIWCSPAIRSGA